MRARAAIRRRSDEHASGAKEKGACRHAPELEIVADQLAAKAVSTVAVAGSDLHDPGSHFCRTLLPDPQNH